MQLEVTGNKRLLLARGMYLTRVVLSSKTVNFPMVFTELKVRVCMVHVSVKECCNTVQCLPLTWWYRILIHSRYGGRWP